MMDLIMFSSLFLMNYGRELHQLCGKKARRAAQRHWVVSGDCPLKGKFWLTPGGRGATYQGRGEGLE